MEHPESAVAGDGYSVGMCTVYVIQCARIARSQQNQQLIRLEDLAGVLEREAGRARVAVLGDTSAEVDEHDGREARALEEGGVDGGVVEAGHGAAVKAESAGGEDEVAGLDAGVQVAGALGGLGVVGEDGLDVVVGGEGVHLGEPLVVDAEDRGDGGGAGLGNVAGHQGLLELVLGLGGAHEADTERVAVEGGGGEGDELCRRKAKRGNANAQKTEQIEDKERDKNCETLSDTCQ